MATDEGAIELTVRGRGRRCYVPQVSVLVSRGGVEVPRWLEAAHVTVGDYVGVSVGGEWASTPAVLPTLVDRVRYGSEKRITVPSTMTTELAFLLGSYLAEGHTTRSNWSVILTNSVMEVLERAQRAWASEFGLHARVTRQPGRCTGLVVSSKRLVEFMELLDCGSRASNKRVPEPILRGTRKHALAFMQGVALDAYTTCGPGPKWAICLESSLAIDGLQDVVTKLGVVNATTLCRGVSLVATGKEAGARVSDTCSMRAQPESLGPQS